MERKDNQKVKRGEIYLYDFGNNEGSIQNGIRPVLIVQCDEPVVDVFHAFFRCCCKSVLVFPLSPP